MNILIYTRFYPSETSGGVEHVTFILREQFSSLGQNITILYKQGDAVDEDINAIQLPIHNESDFISSLCKERNISKVIIQGDIEVVSLFENLKNECEIFYVHHGDPGYGYTTTLLSTYLFYLRFGNWRVKISCILRIILFPLIKTTKYFSLRKMYKSLPTYVNKVVLISSRSINSFMHYSGIKRNDFVTYVNNPLSYEICSDEHIRNKEKVVLVVCRMEEFTKKTSLALNVWKKVMKNKEYTDWTLKIVGDGKDLSLYKSMVKSQNISNVVFCGYDNPFPYYKSASIFMMTSVSEGWGMTLTESMQNGCVPIAFDSYPAVRDIVSHGENGFLVEPMNLDTYSKCLMRLMNNEAERICMSIKAEDFVQKFSKEKIAQKWVELLSQYVPLS